MEQTKQLSVFGVLAAAVSALALSLCLCVSSAWATVGNSAYVADNNGVVTIWGEATDADPRSELYMNILDANGTVMGKVVLNDVDGIYAATTSLLTWHAMVVGAEYDTYWTTTWNAGYPKVSAEPAKVALYIDGILAHTANVNLSGPDNLNRVTWTDFFPKGDVSRGMYNTSNNRIQGAVMNANPKESIVLELYSGATKIATTTLTNENYFTNAATELTWSFCINDTSSSWKTVWENGMPRADLAPTSVVLYIDGEKVATNTVTLHKNNFDMVGEEAVWANLDGVNPTPSEKEPEAGKDDTKKEQLAQTGDSTTTAAFAFCALIAAGATAAFVARRKFNN